MFSKQKTSPFHSHDFTHLKTEKNWLTSHFYAVYRKHYPPSLGDEVWRLDKIGKDGAFHKRLSAARIDTVQDFLKLSVIDPDELRKVKTQLGS